MNLFFTSKASFHSTFLPSEELKVVIVWLYRFKRKIQRNDLPVCQYVCYYRVRKFPQILMKLWQLSYSLCLKMITLWLFIEERILLHCLVQRQCSRIRYEFKISYVRACMGIWITLDIFRCCQNNGLCLFDHLAL